MTDRRKARAVTVVHGVCCCRRRSPLLHAPGAGLAERPVLVAHDVATADADLGVGEKADHRQILAPELFHLVEDLLAFGLVGDLHRPGEKIERLGVFPNLARLTVLWP